MEVKISAHINGWWKLVVFQRKRATVDTWVKMDIVMSTMQHLLLLLQDLLMSPRTSKFFAFFQLIFKLLFYSENAFKVALTKNGPLSVAIDASKRTFSFYSHGVFYEETCGNTMEELDHAVVGQLLIFLVIN